MDQWHVQSLEPQTTAVARRLRWCRRLACSVVVLTVFSLPLPLGAGAEERRGNDRKGDSSSSHKRKDDADKTLKSLEHRIRALERKLRYLTSAIGEGGFPELVITGANLRIVNGLEITESANGLGNLIVGYNEPRFPGFAPVDVPVGDNRTGSHNIVVGQFHNFSSFGGLVVGQGSDISGQFASVSGGLFNTASDLGASVSGGARSMASGGVSSISGGLFNTAIGSFSSVSGGTENTAREVQSWVSGGLGNMASGVGSSISGGSDNTASGALSTVGGGQNRTAAELFDWVAGELFQNQ